MGTEAVERKIKNLQRELRDTVPGSEEEKAIRRKIQELEAQLDDEQPEIRKAKRGTQKHHRRKMRVEDLQDQFDILNSKIKKLRIEMEEETNPDVRLELNRELDEMEDELFDIEEQLNQFE